MKPPKEDNALNIIRDQLEYLVGEKADLDNDDPFYTISDWLDSGIYPVVNAGELRFVIEYKSSAQLGVVARSIEQLSRVAKDKGPEIPLLVVPFMGDVAKRKCAEAHISWLDLSGNADITGPGLRLYVRGKINKFKQPGRRENPFAPKSSRITRRLVYQPERTFTQRELAIETGLGEGFVSRIVKTLEAQHLIVRGDRNRVSVANPTLLLDVWQQGYDFLKHDIIRGHVSGRSGEEIQDKLSKIFRRENIEYAATGLGAAWLYSRFAAFRTVSVYLKELPSDDFLKQIGFRDDTAGSNLWLIMPKDVDVFHAVKPVEDIHCVHPVQVYLDLHGHPERAEEAAVELRRALELKK